MFTDSNVNDDNSEIQDQEEVVVVILVLGIKFWQTTVEKQKIVELKHCKVIINYLQGFLSDLNRKSDDNNLKKDEPFAFDIKCEENIDEEDEDYGFNDIGTEVNGDNSEDEDYKPRMKDEKGAKPKVLSIKFSDDHFKATKEEEELSKKDKILQRIERAKSKRAKSKTQLIKYKKMGETSGLMGW